MNKEDTETYRSIIASQYSSMGISIDYRYLSEETRQAMDAMPTGKWMDSWNHIGNPIPSRFRWLKNESTARNLEARWTNEFQQNLRRIPGSTKVDVWNFIGQPIPSRCHGETS